MVSNGPHLQLRSLEECKATGSLPISQLRHSAGETRPMLCQQCGVGEWGSANACKTASCDQDGMGIHKMRGQIIDSGD